VHELMNIKFNYDKLQKIDSGATLPLARAPVPKSHHLVATAAEWDIANLDVDPTAKTRSRTRKQAKKSARSVPTIAPATRVRVMKAKQWQRR